MPTQRPGDFSLVIRGSRGELWQRIDYSVAGAANLARAMERSSELGITLAKSSIAAGGTLQLEIKAPYAGAGLITVERDRVYAHKWFVTETNTTVQTIEVPRELEIGGYVAVAFVRSPKSEEVLVSSLAHGVVPFSIDRECRNIVLGIESAALGKPGQAHAIRVKSNRPARAVIYAVDEGILRVAGYATPRPLDHFLKKRALGVRTAQLLDLILPGQRRLGSQAPGGDADGRLLGANLNPFKRKTDRPAVYWSGVAALLGRVLTRRRRRRGLVLGGVLLFLCGSHLIPHRRLSAGIPSSRAVLAADGSLLRLTLAEDGQYRLWTPLAEIAPALIESTLLYEDRAFRYHPGVNPVALLRAAARTYLRRGQRQGGSTLTMQLARRLYGIDSQTVSGKLEQIARALWLELRYSKDEILEAHLNLMPLGGNLEGVGAASRIYFAKPARQLQLAEALTLAVIPQSPSARGTPLARGKPAPRGLLAARDRLFARYRARHAVSAAEAASLALPLAIRSASELPFLAPHLAEAVLQRVGGRESRRSGPRSRSRSSASSSARSRGTWSSTASSASRTPSRCSWTRGRWRSGHWSDRRATPTTRSPAR